MRNIFLFKNLRSNYCKTVFLIALILGYYITPQKIFNGNYVYIAIPFILLFALTITCIVRQIKERVVSSRTNGTSILAIIPNIVGISTLQVCGIGIPACGASIGIGILTAIFPNIILTYLHNYSVSILLISIFIQIYSLYSLKCFNSTIN